MRLARLRRLVCLAILSLAGCASVQLDRISSRLAIQDTLVALFMGTDSKDWKAVQDVFAPKVKFDMTSLTGGSPKELTPGEISAIWAKGLKDIPIIHHQGGNYQIQVHGEQADAHYYGVAFHYRPNASLKSTRVFVGSYDAHLTRSQGRWKIDAFRYNSQFVEGNLNLDKEVPMR
jgi:hypothetical protein